ncbi:MAG: hypothetical protein HKN14_09480 [Marinicaulis sp.]|nr:hypothetical protein [Marinicaulis sp.]NNE41132.1 hypothetical protein [Marinicaulis sp.]NNL88480.1 hypothetical protein [Marinicaulis sp.]
MGFGAKQAVARVSENRLSAVAGVGAAGSFPAGSSVGAARRVSIEPDLSKIRKCRIEETPEERKKRLAAKTVNFGATIIARLVIIAALGVYAWGEYQTSGRIHRGVLFGLVAMGGDLGRVLLKMMEPGSK